MVEKVGKVEISNQKFSQKGMQLAQLKENKQVYDFFKKAGLSDDNYVYASDIQNVFGQYDKDKNGKLSIKEARTMGFEGSRKEVKNAVKLLNDIIAAELTDKESEVFPTKVNENETDYYNKDGEIQYKAETVKNAENTVQKFTYYNDGDTKKVSAYAEISDSGLSYMVKYKDNEHQKPEREIINNNGNVQTTDYEYDENDNLKRTIVETNGCKISTELDEYERVVRIEEDVPGSDLKSVIINKYDDQNSTLTQIIQNHPVNLKDGIVETENTYTIDEESGKPDELISSKQTDVQGNVSQYKQVAQDTIEEIRDGVTITTKRNPDGSKTATVVDGDETYTIEYDKDGNTYVYVKNGETFKTTAERLLGKNASEKEINDFRELNRDLIHTYGKNKVESFRVGEKIRVPGELEYNETNKANLTVDPEKEIALYSNRKVTPPTNKQVDETDNKTVDKTDNKPVDKTDNNAVTLETNKQQLDNKGIAYKVNGNKLAYTNDKGHQVIATFKNGLKEHETSYPKELIKDNGELISESMKYYDKEYQNGVITRETEYYNVNPKRVLVERVYNDGVITKESKFMDENDKIELAQNNSDLNLDELLRKQMPKQETEFENGKKAKITNYLDGDKNKIYSIETIKDGYKTLTIYKDGDTSKIDKVMVTYPNDSNFVVKRYKNGKVTELEDKNSSQTFIPQYSDNGKVKTYTKKDDTAGTVLNFQGNVLECKLAQDLYSTLNGPSCNSNTAKLLDKIDESNIVDVLEKFQSLSSKEPLFEYVNNEWGKGLGRPKLDPIIEKLVDLAGKYGIKNKQLTELLKKNKDGSDKPYKYSDTEIQIINENTELLAKQLRKEYQNIIKRNM